LASHKIDLRPIHY